MRKITTAERRKGKGGTSEEGVASAGHRKNLMIRGILGVIIAFRNGQGKGSGSWQKVRAGGSWREKKTRDSRRVK